MAVNINIDTKTNRAIIKMISRKKNITYPLSGTVDQARQHLGSEIESYQQQKVEARETRYR